MCRFIESIQLSDGELRRIALHQERVNRVFNNFFPDAEPFSLNEVFSREQLPQKGLYKCRIVFDKAIQLIEIQPYRRREIRSLKLVDATIKSLPYKSENRSELNEAYAKRQDCDDVLIVVDDFITDSWYANVALWDGENWYTPAKPIIYGVQRKSLLNDHKILEKDIAKTTLADYKRIRLFNAMIEFGELELPVEAIR